MIPITAFLSGFAMATFAASTLFFLKFWRASRDRFFLYFGFACALFAVERAAGVIFNPIYTGTDQITDTAVYVYVIRLAGFIMLLIGIWEKNRPAQS